MTAGQGMRSPSGLNAVLKGMFRTPGIVPRINLAEIQEKHTKYIVKRSKK